MINRALGYGLRGSRRMLALAALWLAGLTIFISTGCSKRASQPIQAESEAVAVPASQPAISTASGPATSATQPRANSNVAGKAESPQALTAAEELNLLAMGDWGEGVPAQKKVAGAMADYVAANGGKFSGLLSAGDNFYVPLTGVDDPVWQNLFEKMYDPQRLDFPFYIALGNHDYDQKKFQIEFAYARQHPQSRWKQPGRWFRVDLPENGPLATVIILDSNHDDLTPLEWNLQKAFLEQELNKPRAPWTICVAHHPLFSNGFAADNGILQRDWGMLFKKYNVDIYLCGHDHTLQHLEIPGWKTSFVIAGGGGAHSHPMRADDRGPFSRSIYGFVHFDFTPEQVVVHYIGADGKPVHVFRRSKAGAVKTLLNTPSDPGVDKPLEVIQGLYDKLHPATAPATQPAK